MRSNEVLAKIRLNLANVDQFLVIACSLAEENAKIKQAVYEASKEVKSAAVLIDHLRNLFNHQELIKLNSSCLESRLQVCFQSQQHFHTAHQQQQTDDKTHLLFTYSNQATLVKASKSLVANVAKILYLTNSVVSLASDDQGQEDLEKVSGGRR